MRTKIYRQAKAKRHRWVLLAGVALSIALAIIFYANIGGRGDKSPNVAATTSADLPGVRAAISVLTSKAQTPLPSTPEIDAITATLNEVAKPDEILILVYKKMMLAAQIAQFQHLLKQVESVKLTTEPPGNLSNAELQRYGGIDDYGAVEQQVSNDIANMKNYLIDNYLQQLERRRLVWKIDTYLQKVGSPMYGCGEYFVQGQERTGIPATLPVGIAYAESSAGLKTYRHPPRFAWPPPPQQTYNAYGMIGPEYYYGFGSWEAGIQANFDYLVNHFGCPQTMHQCPGYCKGNTTMQTVDGVQATINGYDASVVH